MKYEVEYKRARDKKDFIALLLKLYPHLDKTTPAKRYYDLRKEFGELPVKEQKVIKDIEPAEVVDEDAKITKPSHLKMLLLQDMRRFKTKITKDYLRKYGFTEDEILWVMANEKGL